MLVDSMSTSIERKHCDQSGLIAIGTQIDRTI